MGATPSISIDTAAGFRGLELRSVGFSYAGAPVLQEIDLQITEGEFVCLLGASGSGKSTLLRLLAGLERPHAGGVYSDGIEIAGPSLERGVVFQDYSLYPWLTLAQNLHLALRKSHPEKDEAWRRQHIAEHLGQVGLAEHASKYPSRLSGGMQQRGAIARALALGSPVLLMDEPFGALDPVNRAKLQDLLLRLWTETRKTIVFVTHDVEEALYLGDRVVILAGSPARVTRQIVSPFARPRSRSLLHDREFTELNALVHEQFRAEMLQRIEQADEVSAAERQDV